MKKIIKLLALITCISLLLLCFVACGEDKNEEKDDKKDDAVTTKASDDDTDAGEGEGNTPGGDEQGGENSASIDVWGTDKDPYVQDLESWD